MLKTIFITLLALVVNGVWANPKVDPEAYKTQIRKYIVTKAAISDDDADKFFNLFDEMRAKERACFSKMRIDRKNPPKNEEACRTFITQRDNIEISLKKLQQQYHNKMLKVLPATTVMKCLFYAEEFDRMKLREMNFRHQSQHRQKGAGMHNGQRGQRPSYGPNGSRGPKQ